MGTGARRPHTKSRHGCQQCKKNRTKCDEQKPSCSRCLRTGASCSLIDPSSALIIINGAKTKLHSRVQSSSRKSPAAETSNPPTRATQLSRGCSSEGEFVSNTGVDVNMEALIRSRLLKHYHSSTAIYLCGLALDTKEGRAIWQVEVPRLALQHDFLLHGILSSSALHTAICNAEVRNEHRILAIQHHNAGLALYAPHLNNITEDNVDALFAFACLLALYSFGIHLKSDLDLSPLAKIHEVFTLLRGTGGIVKTGEAWLQKGIFRPWFAPDHLNNVGELPPEIEETLLRLKSRISTTITTSSQSEMYLASIEALRLNFFHAVVLPRTQMSLVFLPVISPPEFLPMVCIGEPLALSILANWAVVLYWLRNHLWIQDWGAKTIKAIQEVLPTEWTPCIEWALGQLNHAADPLQLLTPNYTPETTVVSEGVNGGGTVACIIEMLRM